MDIIFSEQTPPEEDKELEKDQFTHTLNTLYVNGRHLETQLKRSLAAFDALPSPSSPPASDLSTNDLYQPSCFEQIQILLDNSAEESKGVHSPVNAELRQESASVVKALAKDTFPCLGKIESSIVNPELSSFKGIQDSSELKEHQKERNYIYSPYDIARGYGSQEAPKIQSAGAINDLLYKVAIYHPYTGKKTQEFLVCGSQSLYELKKNIYCVINMLTDMCDSRGGSFFFIEGCFYEDDTELPIAEEIVNAQRKHMENLKCPLDPPEFVMSNSHKAKSFPYNPSYYAETKGGQKVFAKKSMQNTQWRDLSVRLGVPYLFRHRSECDHVFAVHDIRRADVEDPGSVKHYPFLVFQSKMKRFLCTVCTTQHAKFICKNDRLAPEKPLYICEQCYKITHFDAKGQLLYNDFNLYLYYHD
eukprot:TRINITY_DN5132_c0_g1_i3.p1 TRINITY_DN5132_c0_g1~~TRINITY_DN5132_c0_g1_i3.p1  ORF type:complete len:417 (-),score=84.97 TRINITY_DN5132_c0_g1_i3:115-1365(-)